MNGGDPLPEAWPRLDRPADLGDLVFERLLGRRVVFLRGALDLSAATSVAAQLMALDAEAPDAVTLVVNSSGGPLDAGFTVIDTMELMRGRVETLCLGRADGTAAAVVAAGTGTRRSARTAAISLRLARAELDESAAGHLQEQAEALLALRDRLASVVAERTGQPRERVTRDMDDGPALRAEEALAYGLIDAVAGAGR